jgi:N-acetylglucosaminyldiphosphoundecaprenol N-acetyl-beta-D-mannosaminyltransferase
MRKLLIVMGVPIDDLDMPAALARIEEFISEGRATGTTHQIATVNADFAIKAQDDPELRMILQEADMATADGMPLVWGAKLLGVNLPGRVTGADLVPALAALAAEKGYSSLPSGRQSRRARSRRRSAAGDHPAIRIVGAVSPPFAPVLNIDPALVEDIRNAQPDILLVAFGNPKQEKWIAMHAPEAQSAGNDRGGRYARFHRWRHPPRAGVDAAIRPRMGLQAGSGAAATVAPLHGGPRRLRLLLHAPVGRHAPSRACCGGAVPLRRSHRWQRRALLPNRSIGGIVVLSVGERLTIANCEPFLAQADEALAHSPHIVIDLARTTFVDSSGYGALVTVAKRARAAGGELRLATVQPQVMQVLRVLRLEQFFETYADTAAALLAVGHAAAPARGAVAAPPEPAVAAPAGWQAARAPRRLDAASAPEFRARCTALLAASPRLIVDLSETVFLASAGLAVLIALSREARALNGEVRLACLMPDALRVLKLAKLDGVLAVYPDVTKAGT